MSFSGMPSRVSKTQGTEYPTMCMASVDVAAPFRLRDVEFISGSSARPVQPRISRSSAEHQHGNMLVARTRVGGMGEGQTEPKELHTADAGAPGCH
uniref:Uncharacterized protein n=1 Tax=Hyaloperonospora arabidopsidis (strain Emoy2) TaxID=559515 RepID=M4C316_HYAAE